MRRTLLRAAVCLMALSIAGFAAAQEPVTVLLKSGDRVSGNLVDLTSAGFIIDISGQERRIPMGDAAVIDFAGGNAQNLPAGEVEKVGGQHLLVLHGDQFIQGQLYDIGGRHPLRITFTSAGQHRDYGSDQVARIYLATPASGAVTTSAATQILASGEVEVHVPANQAWTSAGVSVRRGQRLTFSSSGAVQLSADGNDTAPVSGRPGRVVSAGAPLPGVLGGALIGRIGSGKPFGIGDQSSIVAPETGALYLGVNDDGVGDNSGEFVVVVSGWTTDTMGGARRR